MSKDLKKITISTVPNGYVMTVDVDQYMYFTKESLVEGFFTHVGLEISKYLDSDTMQRLMTACATWPNEGDAIQEAAKLTEQVELLQQTRTTNSATIANLRSQLASTSQKLADTTAKLARFLSASKAEDEKKKNKSSLVTKGDVMPKEKTTKNTNYITTGDVIQPKTKRTKKAALKPQVTIPYSEDIYQSLMLPLTIDKTGLPTRVLSVMKIVGGKSNATVGDALIHIRKEYEKTRGFGKGVAEKLDAFIQHHNLAYGMNVEEILMKHAMMNNPNIK